MKTSVLYLLLAIIAVSFSVSCRDTLYSISNVYIENPTNTEYLVCLDYKSYHEEETNLFCVVLPNTPRQIIDSQLTINDIDNIWRGLGDYRIWIYNKKDSTYVKIEDRELFPFCEYGRHEEDYSERKNNITIYNAYYTINDSLLIKMTKDTHLTDSIFGFRK